MLFIATMVGLRTFATFAPRYGTKMSGADCNVHGEYEMGGGRSIEKYVERFWYSILLNKDILLVVVLRREPDERHSFTGSPSAAKVAFVPSSPFAYSLSSNALFTVTRTVGNQG